MKKEITSIEAYEKTQREEREDEQRKLDAARNRLSEVEQKEDEVAQNLEDRRERLRAMTDQGTALKAEYEKQQEQRK